MEWLAAKFGAKAAKLIAFLAVAAVVIGLMVVAQCTMRRGANTQVKVATGQAGAALDSGKDAVNTVGNQQAAEQATDDMTRDHADAIRNIQGADAPVPAAAATDWHRIMCQRPSYRSLPECVQHALAR